MDTTGNCWKTKENVLPTNDVDQTEISLGDLILDSMNFLSTFIGLGGGLGLR